MYAVCSGSINHTHTHTLSVIINIKLLKVLLKLQKPPVFFISIRDEQEQVGEKQNKTTYLSMQYFILKGPKIPSLLVLSLTSTS